jgi:hypothetical protein
MLRSLLDRFILSLCYVGWLGHDLLFILFYFIALWVLSFFGAS